jgi:negative regulator of flagellin synthesis FlgM
MTTRIEGQPPPKPMETRIAPDVVQSRAGSPRAPSVAATPEIDSLRLTGEALGLKAMAKELAAPPKLDMAKIRDIRSAIENGSYKIDPQEIADRLLALERELLK